MISELSVKCKVKRLWISDNDGTGEDQELYSIITNPSNVLEHLYMDGTKLLSNAAIDLFTALKDKSKLK